MSILDGTGAHTEAECKYTQRDEMTEADGGDSCCRLSARPLLHTTEHNLKNANTNTENANTNT